MNQLVIDDLAVTYRSDGERVYAVQGVSLHVQLDEIIGLVGESGCGKTTLGKSILRLLPPSAVVERGRIWLGERELLSMPLHDFRRLRWRELATIPQSAMHALNPVQKVGEQIVEVLRHHERMTPGTARRRAVDLLETVGLYEAVFDRYPHQLSGGMRQRVVIAMAIAFKPVVIVADEPTTGLDVITQFNILRHLYSLYDRRPGALILITHDISLVSQFCDRIVVMYAGRVVEEGPTSVVVSRPAHPYTMGLIAAFPTVYGARRELVSIPGDPPDLSMPSLGCPFQPRCPFAEPSCAGPLPWAQVGERHWTACVRYQEAETFRARAKEGAAVWEAVVS